eukprot:TRINITY_DN1551_c0_g1_i3.p1 TRINITY_DN1551_c0_g1~~TRINITY_DN1551_c0_g1_i3.p1  ORF type:complete len:161 (+),score=19.43 TRINITY_DN1551_c0_g1_i3:55-537(+)
MYGGGWIGVPLWRRSVGPRGGLHCPRICSALFNSTIRRMQGGIASDGSGKGFSVAWVTAPNQQVAQNISTALLEKKLVACVNLIPGIQSMFWWEGKICTEQEVLLMLKTETSLLGEVIKTVKSSHTYSVPEIISAPLGEGNPDYYKWIAESVQNSEKSAL